MQINALTTRDDPRPLTFTADDRNVAYAGHSGSRFDRRQSLQIEHRPKVIDWLQWVASSPP